MLKCKDGKNRIYVGSSEKTSKQNLSERLKQHHSAIRNNKSRKKKSYVGKHSKKYFLLCYAPNKDIRAEEKRIKKLSRKKKLDLARKLRKKYM